jgi:hypothetical protein
MRVKFLLKKEIKKIAEKLVTIPSSHLKNKNSMGRNCINKELNGGPKEEILQLGHCFCINDQSKVDV